MKQVIPTRECQDEWMMMLLEDVVEHIRDETHCEPNDCDDNRHERRVSVAAVILNLLGRTGFSKAEGFAILKHVAHNL